MRGEIYDGNRSNKLSDRELDAALKRHRELKMTKTEILRSRRNVINLPKKWTANEEKQLLNEYEEGLDLNIIATAHGRSPNAIRARLHHSGIILTDER